MKKEIAKRGEMIDRRKGAASRSFYGERKGTESLGGSKGSNCS